MPAGAVLVVDDDSSIVETVADILEYRGYQVVRASNGQEALASFPTEPEDQGSYPALVLLDRRMPILDGSGFAAELKHRGVAIPLVAMTGAQEASTWAAEIGAAACLPKPFEIDQVLDTVSELLSGRGEVVVPQETVLELLRQDLALGLLALEAVSDYSAVPAELRELVEMASRRLLQAADRVNRLQRCPPTDRPDLAD